MKTYRWILAAGSAFALSAAAACGSSSSSSTNDAGSDAGTPPAGDSGPQGNQDSGSNDGFVLGFTPTNLAPGQLPTLSADGGAPGNVSVSDPSCKIDTDQGTISCANAPFAYTQVTGTGGSLAVFVVSSLNVQAAGQLQVKGSLPLAIVALNTVTIDGALLAAGTGIKAVGGGATSTQNGQAGAGPGGGAAGAAPYAPAGASYCGIGGAGAAGLNNSLDGGTPPAGGMTYGNATLSPLVGGSAGGAYTSNVGGAGGGAIQIVAKTSIAVGSNGSVNVGGGGGPGPSSDFGGGGSGGAILLEAPTVSIAGILAANGGGGGNGGAAGQDGQASLIAAKGATPGGGDGSAADSTAGTAGTHNNASSGGAGGGGAGRIRINTTSGAATIGGHLTPSETSTCASEGTIAK